MKKPKGDKAFTKPTSGKLKVEEPIIAYSTGYKTLTISTVAEQEQNNYLFWLSLSPSQRIANATELIRSVYADELTKPAKPSVSFLTNDEYFTGRT